MSYRSIIAVASGGRDDGQLLIVAVELASRCSAQVRVLPGFADPAADLVYFGAVLNRAPGQVMERVRAGEQDQQARIEQLAVDAAASAGVRFDGAGVGASITVEKRALMPAIALAEAAVLADLVMFSAKPARDPYALGAPFAETLLDVRAPILLIKDAPFTFGAAAIAWDGSVQASRAVRGAMNFLRLTEEVVILQNLADLNTKTRTPATAEQLAQHLSRHGVARTRIIPVEGDNIAKSLVAGARAHGCTALVAGAYGRPRLYEFALGGTTRALVADESMHLFLAH
jgi:nucleotide-binding universal stress UspA family protein